MTTKEIQDAIQKIDILDNEAICNLLGALADNLAALEFRVEAVEVTAAHANNIASCLANGIQPD